MRKPRKGALGESNWEAEEGRARVKIGNGLCLSYHRLHSYLVLFTLSFQTLGCTGQPLITATRNAPCFIDTLSSPRSCHEMASFVLKPWLSGTNLAAPIKCRHPAGVKMNGKATGKYITTGCE